MYFFLQMIKQAVFRIIHNLEGYRFSTDASVLEGTQVKINTKKKHKYLPNQKSLTFH